MPVTAKINASVSGGLTMVQDLGTASSPFTLAHSISLASGVAANQVDKVFHDTRTLGASATEDLDLAGILLDGLGLAITFAKLKFVLISADSANTNNVNFSRPATNGVPLFAAAGDLISIQPGGCFMWSAPGLAGVTVTAGTGDLMTFANSGAGTSVTYSVVLMGTSA